jgi:hypothetical protein
MTPHRSVSHMHPTELQSVATSQPHTQYTDEQEHDSTLVSARFDCNEEHNQSVLEKMSPIR